jgi:hypothetical protein
MYEMKATDEFFRRSKDARKRDLVGVVAAMKEICKAPTTARSSHPLKDKLAGYRGADYDGGDRFIFRICDECVRNNQTTLHPLDCCAVDGRPLLVVTFVGFGDYHKSAGRRRITSVYVDNIIDPPDEWGLRPKIEQALAVGAAAEDDVQTAADSTADATPPDQE